MPSKNIVDFAYQVRDYMRGAEVVEGKNHAYSQENNAVIATIENGKSYKVRWTGSATVTLKKNSASGTEVTSGSTSPLSFTADSDFDLYFGSSADVTEIMVYDGNDTSDTYEPYYVPVKDRVDELTDAVVVEDITSSVTFNNNITWDTGWNHIYKCGKYIWGSLRFKTPSTTSSDYTLLTLPSGCTPIHEKGIVGTMSKSWTGEIAGIISYLSNNNLILASDAWQTNTNVLANIAFFIQ